MTSRGRKKYTHYPNFLQNYLQQRVKKQTRWLNIPNLILIIIVFWWITGTKTKDKKQFLFIWKNKLFVYSRCNLKSHLLNTVSLIMLSPGVASFERKTIGRIWHFDVRHRDATKFGRTTIRHIFFIVFFNNYYYYWYFFQSKYIFLLVWYMTYEVNIWEA